jgi:hypothetical protein
MRIHFLGAVGLCIVFSACGKSVPEQNSNTNNPTGESAGTEPSMPDGVGQEGGDSQQAPPVDAGDAGAPDAGPKDPLCIASKDSFGYIRRGSENGLERVVALAEDAGDLVAVVADESAITLARWPASGAPLVETPVATMTDAKPYSPSLTFINGAPHVTWIDASKLQHATLKDGTWTTTTVATGTGAGALVRGASEVEIIWVSSSDGSVHDSKPSGDAWIDSVTLSLVSPGAGPLEAVQDSTGDLHAVYVDSGGVVEYLNSASGKWKSILVGYDDPGSKVREASIAVTSSDVYVAWASPKRISWGRRTDEIFLKETLFEATDFLSGALGVALTARGATPWVTKVTLPPGGPGLLTTPVEISPLPAKSTATKLSSQAYAFTPAMTQIGDTMHIVWGIWDGLGKSAFIYHASCK